MLQKDMMADLQLAGMSDENDSQIAGIGNELVQQLM